MKASGVLKGKVPRALLVPSLSLLMKGAAPAETGQLAQFLSLSTHVGTRKVVTYA